MMRLGQFFAVATITLLASLASAQTVTFTTSGGGAFPLHYNVNTENGGPASGSFEVQQTYGYENSAVILSYNPVAPLPTEALNPIIDIIATTYVGNGTATRVVTYTFNSNADPQYGYVWSGTFTATENCTRFYRYTQHCAVYGSIGSGSGTMTASPVQ